ncbi:helix-turn-helix domain-containing protein [Chloroflexus aggregans]|uniref:Transcriptional regulator, XRE family n=1 Tax=Chloroflexus aggregans (strain MD-66 / DSM 9485) TaxID=326427 RepID=B8G9Z4_CHLAD|nr:RodZ domain-containing protein [Chloroflexus aggregans]ACL24509.1 transcriptional regulator, XRE family [Chloroflexus aggregans DSM 9485]
MSELGARLRRAREANGISLAQAAAETRILLQSLQALEEGAFERLPSDVVARGFIRNYAQYLGLPPDEMIDLYRRERGATDKIRVVPATNPPRTRMYVLPSFFAIFFITLVLVGLAYVGLSALGRIGERATPSAGVAPSPTIVPPSPLPTPSLLPTGVIAPPTPTSSPLAPTPVVVTTPEPSPTPIAPIVIEVRVPNVRGNEASWVRVQTDGNTVFEAIMRAGEQRVFTAQRRVFIRAGNPTDVEVTVNGLQQGPLGTVPGQPVNWSWPPN